MWGLEHIKAEWAALKAAPIAFVILIVIGFFSGMYLRAEQVENALSLVKVRDAELEFKEIQLDAYRKSLEERVDKIEKTLSAQQVTSLQNTLKAFPSMVGIVKGPASLKPYATQWENAFSSSGWKVQSTEAAQVNGLLLRAPDAKTATTIGNALEKAGVKYESVQIDNTTGVTEFLLGKPEL